MFRFIAALLLSAVTLWAPAPVAAQQDYPNRQITIIVSFPPGGVSDLIARVIAERLRVKWNQPVVVLNKPGAGSMLGLGELARAKPDGYTFGTGSNAVIQSALLAKNVPYKVSDFEPISLLYEGPYIITVSPSAKSRTLPDFIKEARANPGLLRYATTGVGPPRFATEIFMREAGIKLTEVPYRASPEMTMGLLRGEIELSLDAALNIKPNADAGKLFPIAIADKERLAIMPNVPSAPEAGLPQLRATFWAGLFAPAGVPREIVNKVNAEVAAIMRSPDVQEMIASKAGAKAIGSSAETFREFMQTEFQQFKKLADDLGLKPE